MRILTLAAGFALAGAIPGQQSPVELGTVAWQRDFDAAVVAAKSSDRPLLALFQEVPG